MNAKFSLAIKLALAVLLAALSACAGAPTPPPLPSPTRGGVGGEVVPRTATPVPPTATPAPPTATPTPVTLKGMADDVARGVGIVRQVVEGDPQKVIFIFYESHLSRVGQVNATIMLNRLYARYRLRHIGLEGATADKGTLNLAWAHRKPYYQPGQKITGREDVIVQTLKDGEISGAELIGLIYADVVVHGIENAKLYAYEVTLEAMNVPFAYLLAIAKARMNNEQRVAYQTLDDQKKYDAAFKFAMSTDKFTAFVWGHITASDPTTSSAEEYLELLDQIKQEFEKERLKSPTKQQADFEALREFVRAVSLRSDVMVANMLKIAAANPGAPLALFGTGADHIKRMVELFTKAGVSVVVVGSSAGGAEISNEAWIRKNRARSVAPAGTLGRLLSGGRKPPPVADQEWYKFLEQMRQSADEMARETAKASDQNGGDPAKIGQAANSAAGMWAGFFGNVSIAFDGSTFPPKVQVTIVLPNGQTVNSETQLIPGTYNPNNPDSVPNFDLDGLLDQTADDLKTTSAPAPQPGDPEQISSNAQATYTGPGVPPPSNPNWWNMTPEGDGIWRILPGGVKETWYFDGRKVTEYPGGPTVTEYREGPISKVTEYKDQQKVTEYRDGPIVKVTENTDGPTVTEYKSGIKVTKYQNGTTITERPYELALIQMLPTKETVIPGPDGPTTITENPGGTKTTVRPNGDISTSHIVQPYETLESIARTYGIPLERLLANNPGINPDTIIRSGDELIIEK